MSTYYVTNCDTCGRFMQYGQPGSSWVMVPAIDVPGHTSGDERERCAVCTEKHGPAECGPEYVKELCCGVYPKSAAPDAQELIKEKE
jgi:hypothetical protein